MKIKNILFALIIYLISYTNIFSDEIKFDANELKIKDNGNITFAYDANIYLPENNIKIFSKIAEYNKSKEIITLSNEVYLNDIENNIILKGSKIIYKIKKNIYYTVGKSEISVDKKYKIFSENITYDRESNALFSEEDTIIEDTEKNIYKLKEKFNFDTLNEIIYSKKTLILDKNDNKYVFDDTAINLKTKEVAGNEIKLEFEDSYFGNKKNDPILKGRSAYSNDDELKVYKAVFSTCNIQEKKCRGWELSTEEFSHDKEKKLFEYRDSWLKIFNYKVFYLPYFNHPDPTVKRKSGFLTPSYTSSDTLGTSINIPYFRVLSKDKDITFSPRFYVDKSFLLQNEYRQALQNSNILSDFSFLVGNEGTKGHFFFNQIGSLSKNANYEINLQDVKGDNYLKSHKLINTSTLIKDDNILLSNFDMNLQFKDSSLFSSFKIYEDLSRNFHDRYQYIFPEFSFSKNLDIPRDYNGAFNFNTYGYNKHYETNITEAVLTNDFLFSSYNYINTKGMQSNYNLLLKNSNNYSNNSNNFNENAEYDLFGLIKFDASLPLEKRTNNYNHYLKPIVSAMYSPNGNDNLSNKDVLLNYDSVFSLNRIGSTYQVEGGESLSLGLEFKKDRSDGKNILEFKTANVIKAKENNNLPTKSKLNKTRSDIFGMLNYNINDNLTLEYFYSYDRDLEYSNLDGLNLEFNNNYFLTNFYYYSENNDFGDKESIKNSSDFYFDDENKIGFEISKNLKDDFTQYYDLIYEYKTDCLSLNFSYNKSFYNDGDLEPNKSLSFLIKIIPFTDIGVSNIGKIINN